MLTKRPKPGLLVQTVKLLPYRTALVIYLQWQNQLSGGLWGFVWFWFVFFLG